MRTSRARCRRRTPRVTQTAAGRQGTPRPCARWSSTAVPSQRSCRHRLVSSARTVAAPATCSPPDRFPGPRTSAAGCSTWRSRRGARAEVLDGLFSTEPCTAPGRWACRRWISPSWTADRLGGCTTPPVSESSSAFCQYPYPADQWLTAHWGSAVAWRGKRRPWRAPRTNSQRGCVSARLGSRTCYGGIPQGLSSQAPASRRGWAYGTPSPGSSTDLGRRCCRWRNRPSRGDLLHGPAVAVRVAEEHEPDVVECRPALTQRIRVAAQRLDLADLDSALDELRVCLSDVRDDQLEALEGAWRHVRNDALADHDRAAGARRRQLDEPVARAWRVDVVVKVEAELVGVEGLGSVDVRS